MERSRSAAFCEDYPGSWVYPPADFRIECAQQPKPTSAKRSTTRWPPIARANPKQLAGVFEHTDFNNKMALPNEDLAAIIDHFHKLGPLDSKRVSTDMLGQAYEWLIAKFAGRGWQGRAWTQE